MNGDRDAGQHGVGLVRDAALKAGAAGRLGERRRDTRSAHEQESDEHNARLAPGTQGRCNRTYTRV